MIRTRQAIMALMMLAPVLAGCEARRLSEMQSQFNQLVSANAACRARMGEVAATTPEKGARDGLRPDDWSCLDDPTTSFQEIARGAQQVNEAAKAPADRVAALRLASLASWQAGMQAEPAAAASAEAEAAGERAPAREASKGPVDYAREATAICDEKPASSGDPALRPGPRDCALVRLMPGLVALETVTRQVSDVDRRLVVTPVPAQEPERSRVQAMHLQSYLAAMNRYDAVAAGAFDRAAREALATPDLPPEFQRYVARQRLIGACAYRKAANQLPVLSGKRATAIPPGDLPKFCPADRDALALEPVLRSAWERARESHPSLAREDFRGQCGRLLLRSEILKQTGIDFDTVDCGK